MNEKNDICLMLGIFCLGFAFGAFLASLFTAGYETVRTQCYLVPLGPAPGQPAGAPAELN